MVEFVVFYVLIMLAFALLLDRAIKIAKKSGEPEETFSGKFVVVAVAMCALWPITLPVFVFFAVKAIRDNLS